MGDVSSEVYALDKDGAVWKSVIHYDDDVRLEDVINDEPCMVCSPGWRGHGLVLERDTSAKLTRSSEFYATLTGDDEGEAVNLILEDEGEDMEGFDGGDWSDPPCPPAPNSGPRPGRKPPHRWRSWAPPCARPPTTRRRPTP